MSFSSFLLQQLMEKQKQDQLNSMVQLPATPPSMDLATLLAPIDNRSLLPPPMPLQNQLPQPFSQIGQYNNPFASMLGQPSIQGIGNPNFNPATSAEMFVNPNDFMQSNEQIANQFMDYDRMADNYVGNASSQQIDSIINDLQTQRQQLPTDVGVGTKLLSAVLGAVGGATGNQALQQQGFNILEGRRQELVNKKDNLFQQEIMARKIKYDQVLNEETTKKKNLTDLFRNASSYAGASAASQMNYRTQVKLTELDTAIKMKIQGSQFMQQRELEAIRNGYEKEFKMNEVFMQLAPIIGGSMATDIVGNLKKGNPLTIEQQQVFDNIAIENKNKIQKDNEFKEKQQELIKEQNRIINPGQLAGNVDLKEINERVQKAPVMNYGNDYLKYYQEAARKAKTNRGVFKTGLGSQVDDAIYQSGDEFDIDPTWLYALMFRESNFNPNAVSSKGATGITQIMPETAKEFGIDINRLRSDKPEDIAYAVKSGAKIFKFVLDKNGGDYVKAAIAYNSGHYKEILEYDINKLTHTYKIDDKVVTKPLPKESAKYAMILQGAVDGYKNVVGDDVTGEKSYQGKINRINKEIQNAEKMLLDTGKRQKTPDGEDILVPDINKPGVKVPYYLPYDLSNPEDVKDYFTQKQQFVDSAYDREGLIGSQEYKDAIFSIKQRMGLIESDSKIKETLTNEIRAKVFSGVDPAQIIQDINQMSNDKGSYQLSGELVRFAVDEIKNQQILLAKSGKAVYTKFSDFTFPRKMNNASNVGVNNTTNEVNRPFNSATKNTTPFGTKDYIPTRSDLLLIRDYNNSRKR